MNPLEEKTTKKRRLAWTESGSAAVMSATSAVKLYCRSCKPDYTRPWKLRAQSSSFSTAFVISSEKRWLLTNRHCVAHAATLDVRRRGDDRTFPVRVLSRGVDCDLALLTVEDDAFWTDDAFPMKEVSFQRQLPALFTEVMCVGYPTGGDNLCVTKGVVSRVDCEDSDDWWSSRLVIQIDAAINPGNSGGPAVNVEGECVGVAYESLKDGDTENIGYIIPADVVMKFLEVSQASSRHGRSHPTSPLQVRAFGHGLFDFQKLENVALRASLGLRRAGEGGVLITSVESDCERHTHPPATALRRGDVLLELNGVAVGRDGRCLLQDTVTERVPFPLATRDKFIGDHVHARVFREGEDIEVSIEMCQGPRGLSCEKEAPNLRDYIIVGGLVFVRLSQQYLRAEFGSDWRKDYCDGLRVPMDSWSGCDTHAKRSEIVVLSDILAHVVNHGYADLKRSRLEGFRTTTEGEYTPVLSLQHLGDLIDASHNKQVHDFLVAPPSAKRGLVRVVMDKNQVHETEASLFRANGVPAGRRLCT